MTTKMSLTTLIAAATLAVGGVAMAQPSSTAGAGCTATANAMRGGNLGGSPSDTACTTAGKASTAAAAPAPTTTATTTEAASTTSMAGASGTDNSAAVAAAPAPARKAAAPVRVARAARADRN